MTVVLTNDDGIDAPGLLALQRALDQKSIVVAPQHHQSGCSHQVTSDRPIAVERRSPYAFAVGGTPADCTRLALRHLCPEVKLVLSGVNAGGNLGTDIYVSGTVAAVREAALHRVPGIAFSQYKRRGLEIDWQVSTRLVRLVLDRLLSARTLPGTFWNVNLPHLEPGAPDPTIVFCPLCTQPLPTDYRVEGETYVYAGNYNQRQRDIGADVEVCFAGNISITQIRLWDG